MLYKQWKSFIITGIFVLATLAIMFAISVAWFANNTKVNADNIIIGVESTNKFELATIIEKEAVDTNRNPFTTFLEKISSFLGADYRIDDNNATVTSGSVNSIRWNMQSQINFANVEGSGLIDGMGEENIGLQPGTSGKLDFYIIPTVSGAQVVNCSISLIPYTDSKKKRENIEVGEEVSDVFSNGEDVWEIKDERVKNILNSHIYFFREINQNSLYSTWLSPDEEGILSFSVELDENTTADQPKLVEIYWTWPTLIAQVILKENDVYLAGRRQLIDVASQEKIVKKMNDLDNFFIKDDWSDVEIDSNIIRNIYNQSLSGTEIDKTEYTRINSLYNNADQLLGRTVSYVVLELVATN